MEPVLFLALETKRNQSIGPIIRCASAFGVETLIVVGSNHFSSHGSHGSLRRMNVLHFFYWADCKRYLSSKYPSISFASLSPSSEPCLTKSMVAVDTAVFSTSALCLLVQPDIRVPLSEDQLSVSDYCLYVRVPSKLLEAHLHWHTKISLAMQAFGLQKGFTTSIHEGFKFSVATTEESRRTVQSFASPSTEGASHHSEDSLNEGDGAADCGLGALFDI
jgi:hypothetical protein